jgi:3-deoxy-manno-octulosonate cytidylyltransferase (CMP-KDO synthetase)
MLMAAPRLKVCGVIPARLGSTRLPGKVLRELAGKPMLQWVLEGADHPDLLEDLIVATDSEEVFRFCGAKGYRVLMTSPLHCSGTDRLAEVATRSAADVYVNIQGDEPLVRREHLEALLEPFGRESVTCTTLATPIAASEAQDPNRVKVVVAQDGRALYFSRSVIPYDRQGSPGGEMLKHLGFYAYTRKTLDLFHSLKPTPLERREKLEQLRLLEHGVAIHVVVTPFDTVGVDTEADLRLAERLLLARTSGAAAGSG